MAVVDDAALRRRSHAAAAEDVRGRRDAEERLGREALRVAVELLLHAARELGGFRDPGLRLRAAAGPRREAAPEKRPDAAAELHAESPLGRAHVEEDHRVLRPVRHERGLERGPRLLQEHRAGVQEARAHRVARRVRHRERAEESRSGRIAHGLEVRVRVRLEDRADRDALREVDVAPLGHDAHEDFRIRAHEVAELLRNPRKTVGALLQLEKKLHRAEDASRKDDAPGFERPRSSEERKRRAAGARRDRITAAFERPYPRDLRVGLDFRAALLGEPEVVLVERVLGLVAAADHAAAAAGTSGALRPFAAEVGIGHLHAGLSEEDGDVRGRPAVLPADVLPHLAENLVGQRRERHARGAQHPLGGGVVRRELALPVGEMSPGRRGEELVGRDGERVRVDERSAAHADARESRDVREERHLEDAAAAHGRQPEPPLHVPVRLREVGGGEARALFEDEHAIALFRETQRAHAPSEPGADDHGVGVESPFHAASLQVRSGSSRARPRAPLPHRARPGRRTPRREERRAARRGP